MIQHLFLGREKRFLFLKNKLALGPTHPPIQLVPGDLLPWVKQMGQEPDPSPPSTAEVRVSRAIHLLPCMLSLCAHKQLYILHM